MRTEILEALDQAIDICEGQSNLARALASRMGRRIHQRNVWSWRNRTGKVPPEVAPYIEVITTEKGQPVNRRQLCPDFPWDVGGPEAC